MIFHLACCGNKIVFSGSAHPSGIYVFSAYTLMAYNT